MENSLSLEQVIRTYINLPTNSTGEGWIPVVCKICNDHGKKGPRAGFKFTGDTTGYHCFNCGHKAKDDPAKNKRISQSMVEVLRAFQVPDEQWQHIQLARLGDRSKHPNVEPLENIEPSVVTLPSSFYYLSDAGTRNRWAEVARLTLEMRGIDYSEYPFMLSTDSKKEEPWYGRIIIPIYKDGKVIYYQGRDMTGKSDKKYRNPSISREKIIYGFDKLFEKQTTPLYIVEGFFDAFVIDGIAIFGNEISKTQATWLNKSQREKVYIPDRLGNGHIGAKQALKYGWSVSTPNIGNCKDINEAVLKYGKLYVLRTINDNIASGFQGEVKIGLYCK